MTNEEIAAMFEAAEEIGDARLVLGILMALREDAFRDEMRAWLSASPATRRALRGLLRAPGPTARPGTRRGEAANRG